MASTIITKNGTGSASPSSLQQGELAINVDNGKIFYGAKGGTAVSSSFTFDELKVEGNLTAQQYIISSSVTYVTQSFSSGSTIFGDTQDDTHQFTGSVDITGSIIATNLSGTNTGDQDLSSYALIANISGAFAADSASFSTRITANEAVTSKTLISSSAQVDHDQTTNFSADEHFTQANITTVGTVTSGDISAILPTGTVSGSSQIDLGSASGTIDISDQTNLAGGTNITLSDDTINLDANISLTSVTASSNISASGDIFSNNATITTQLTAAGIAYPTADGDNGDVLITDGAGNLSFNRTTVYANVKNVHGSELVKGIPVHVTGAVGNTSEVVAASASNAATMPAHFILNETLADDAEGLAIAIGYINGVNTSGFSEGDTVYVGANGGYTNAKPTGSNLIQNLGIVDKVDASNGSGFVLGAGRSNDVPNISPGYAWVGNSDSVATAVATSSFIPAGTVSSSAQIASDISGSFTEASGGFSSRITTIEGAGYTTNTGTVTSVGGTGTVSGLSLSGTVTTSGNLTLGGTISISSTNITDVDAFSQTGTYASLRAQGTTKGDVGLGNVENTALSTYTGNGGALDNQYIANGAGYLTTVDISDDTNLAGGTNLTLSGDTINLDANINLTSVTSSVILTDTRHLPNTDGSDQYYGDVVKFGGGGTLTQGSIYYLNSSQNWALADASAASTAKGMLGIATSTGIELLVKGIARHGGWAGLGHGSVLYLSETAGELTTTAPTTSGAVVRVIGYCTNTTVREIYFNPESSWIELT